MADVRITADFPETETIEEIRVLSPLELIVSKLISFQSRYGKPKSWTDRCDLAVLLLRFPELKEKVSANLQAKMSAKQFWKLGRKLSDRIFSLRRRTKI